MSLLQTLFTSSNTSNFLNWKKNSSQLNIQCRKHEVVTSVVTGSEALLIIKRRLFVRRGARREGIFWSGWLPDENRRHALRSVEREKEHTRRTKPPRRRPRHNWSLVAELALGAFRASRWGSGKVGSTRKRPLSSHRSPSTASLVRLVRSTMPRTNLVQSGIRCPSASWKVPPSMSFLFNLTLQGSVHEDVAVAQVSKLFCYSECLATSSASFFFYLGLQCR